MSIDHVVPRDQTVLNMRATWALYYLDAFGSDRKR